MIYDSPAQAETALVVDLSNLSWRGWHANSELKTSKGVPSGHIMAAMNMLQAIFRDLGKSICPVYCMDGEGARAERQKILPEYKGNREKRDFDPVPGVKELCSSLPGLHIEEPGREGDDAIAYACQLCAKKDIVIYTGDGDLIALMRFPNVKVYSPNKKRFVEQSDWFEEYHVLEAAKIPISKAILGDPSDNIRGVERIIRKQLEPVLNDPKCVDINSFYDMIQEKPASMTEKMWLKAKEAESRVKINYQVILPNITNFGKQSIKRVFKNEQNKQGLLEYLKRFECYSTLERAQAIYE